MKLPKIIQNVPDPPEITPEETKCLIQEGKEIAEDIKKRAKEMEDITPEDWDTVSKYGVPF